MSHSADVSDCPQCPAHLFSGPLRQVSGYLLFTSQVGNARDWIVGPAPQGSSGDDAVLLSVVGGDQRGHFRQSLRNSPSTLGPPLRPSWDPNCTPGKRN